MMRGIPEATVIILMAEERAELEGLARSTKTEHRLRQRARIVLLAADGVASRAIGRAVGSTTGTAIEVAGALRREAACGSRRDGRACPLTAVNVKASSMIAFLALRGPLRRGIMTVCQLFQ